MDRRQKKGKRKREWKRIALVRVLGDESHRVCNNFVADRSTTERRLFFCRYIYIYLFLLFFFFFSCIKDRFPLFSFLQAIGGNLGDLCFVLFFFFLFLWLVTFHSTRLSNRREKGDRHSGLPPLPPSNFECHVSRRKSHDHPVVIYWQNRTNAQAMLLV